MRVNHSGLRKTGEVEFEKEMSAKIKSSKQPLGAESLFFDDKNL